MVLISVKRLSTNQGQRAARMIRSTEKLNCFIGKRALTVPQLSKLPHASLRRNRDNIKQTPWPSVRKRTIPSERPRFVGEI
jgi:hypothetical protein